MNYLLFRLLSTLAFCLSSIVDGREAIVDGYQAKAGEVRYQAAVQIDDHPPKCGGGIITHSFILTAAHCVIARNGAPIGKFIFVTVGTHDLNIAGVVAKVEKISLPTEYNPLNYPLIADIALLKLKEPLTMDERKMMVLYFARNLSVYYENKAARIAGFGWDKIQKKDGIFDGSTDRRLRFIDTNVRSHDECMHDHPTLNLTEQHLCAKAKQYPKQHRGTCLGDGGGPLVLRGVIVIGVLSIVRRDCSEQNNSAIYTRVSYYGHFMQAAIGGYNRDFLITHVLDV